ncbi:MAG TPA: hypothetical protein PLW46_00005 [Acinetobacter johnsonii]|nr:hypothetical protein [Acinetobacter johnsonii]
MDGQVEPEKVEEDTVTADLPAEEIVEVPIPVEPVATPEASTEAVVAETAPIVEEQPVPVEPVLDVPTIPEPAPAVPEPVVVETPPPAEPVVVQEPTEAKEPEAIKENEPLAPAESVPKDVEAVVTPEERRDPMEIAKALDHDVLEAAFKILATERSSGLLKAKLSSDKIKIAENSDRVAKFVASHKNGVRRTTIADKLNMSPSKVTDYLQRLIASGRVRGEGKTNDRRFYIS